MKGIVTTPDPYKPYLLSQAVKAGPYLFVSGQAGYDDDGKIVAGGFLEQGNQAFRNQAGDVSGPAPRMPDGDRDVSRRACRERGLVI